jgi:hypothetical protein
MASKQKDKLTEVSVKIGTALGKANKKARKLAETSEITKEELHEIAKQVEVLKKQLAKTTGRLKKALSA